MSNEARVRIDFACNDPDNGLFAGRVEQLLRMNIKLFRGPPVPGHSSPPNPYPAREETVAIPMEELPRAGKTGE